MQYSLFNLGRPLEVDSPDDRIKLFQRSQDCMNCIPRKCLSTFLPISTEDFIKSLSNAAAGIRTRVTGLGSLCHNRWTTAARAGIKSCPVKKGCGSAIYGLFLLVSLLVRGQLSACSILRIFRHYNLNMAIGKMRDRITGYTHQ